MIEKAVKNTLLDKELDNRKNRELQDVFSKDSDEIKEILMNEEQESGGLTAITGFFYQFLVTLEYIIEMMDGKWDYVSLELHDDIVLVNTSEKLIRFVQVKTSKEYAQKPGDIQNLYAGKVKEEGKIKVKNSWVDKLISKAKHFEGRGYTLQFQLYTSFQLENTSQINLKSYVENNNFNCEISNTDDLLQRISKNTHFLIDKEYKKMDYSDYCNVSAKDLLSAFQIKSGYHINDVRKMINNLIMDFSDRLFKDHTRGDRSHIRITIDDIYTLIGDLASRCNPEGDMRYLILKKENLQGLFNSFVHKAIEQTGDFIAIYEKNQVFDKVFKELTQEVSKLPLSKEREEMIMRYRSYFMEWIKDKDSLEEFFNKYFEGTKISGAFLKEDNAEKVLMNLLRLIIYMNGIYDNNLRFSSVENIITKVIDSEDDNSILSFFNAQHSTDIEQYKNKLKVIYSNISEEDYYSIRDKDVKIMIQDCVDPSFKETHSFPIETELKPDLNGSEFQDEEPTINEVKIPSLLYSGKHLEREFEDRNYVDNYEDFMRNIKEIWREDTFKGE